MDLGAKSNRQLHIVICLGESETRLAFWVTISATLVVSIRKLWLSDSRGASPRPRNFSMILVLVLGRISL